MPITDERAWTVEDVWALPADPNHRYEVVDGTLLVTPAPSLWHQRTVRALLRALHAYATLPELVRRYRRRLTWS